MVPPAGTAFMDSQLGVLFCSWFDHQNFMRIEGCGEVISVKNLIHSGLSTHHNRVIISHVFNKGKLDNKKRFL